MLVSGRTGLAAALVVALTMSTAVSATAALPRDLPPSGGWITLITGDRVALDAGGGISALVAGPGRAGMPVTTSTVDGHHHVVPADAARLVNAGKVDRRLFDVTALARDGYRSATPLIVAPKQGQRRSTTAAHGLSVERDLPSTGLVAMTARDPAAGWRSITAAGSPIDKVWLDATYRAVLDRSTAQIGAREAWQQGYTGKGVKVAVLDSGVDEGHGSLVGKEIAARNFTDSGTADVLGHGTHVASTIAGNSEKYRGVAPDSSILDGKVLADDGGGRTSWILDAMEWAVAQGADVVNMSLGQPDSPGIDPVEEAVNRLSEQGVLFVIAAGNDGELGAESLASPAAADAALAVGAVDRADQLAAFSSKGPRVDDHGIKPDVTAPGAAITAARSSAIERPDPDGDGHVAMSGTSMAAPHVAGAAALLAQRHPDWTGQQLKSALMLSARANPSLGHFEQGSGRIDVPAALNQTVLATPPSLAIGLQPWPHDDDTPTTNRITYRNTGTTPVTFELSSTATGPDGKPSPAGMFTLSATSLTVPAGGTAEVVLTSNTSIPAVDGTYTGTVVATSGDTRLRTAFSVNREMERHEVRVTHLGADGARTDRFGDTFTDMGAVRLVNLVPGADGVATARVPKGEYALSTTFLDAEARLVVLPKVIVDGPEEIVVDARVAKPVRITGPDPAAKTNGFSTSWRRVAGDRKLVHSHVRLNDIDGSHDLPVSWIGQTGPALPDDEFQYEVRQSDIVRGTDPVRTYRYTVDGKGELPDGLDRRYAERELVEVRRTVASVDEGQIARLGAIVVSDDDFYTTGTFARVGASRLLIDHVTPGTWRTVFFHAAADDAFIGQTVSPEREYRVRRTYRETVNQAIFGPTGPRAERWRDRIAVSTPLWADSQGGRGISATDSASTVLYQGDQVLGREAQAGFGEFTVPTGRTALRLESRGTRASVAGLSTSVTGVWHFSTEHSADITDIHLTSVSYAAPLDGANAAKAGRLFRIPLTVHKQEGARTTALRAEVSYDDGATWRSVPVAGGSALINHPRAEGHVSLKVFAADNRGNSVEQTIIRAYRLIR